ncbi:MAG: undecaprenyldiphospho-muramoylpentapeptide beta-N-acetylglucosaminyltransferase [Acidimicrobiales bacterium]
MGGGGRPVVIAGGGTAGHIQPALSVGRALVARGHEPGSIRFVGSARGLEARLVPEAGFPVVLLPGRGIVRRVSWQAVTAAAGLLVAAVRAFWLMLRWRPGVILSVGGYAAAPCSLAALVLRIPLVVAEQNAVPGAVNRISSRWAAACALAFEGTDLPRGQVTGNPVRPEILAVSRQPEAREEAKRTLGFASDAVVIAVTGGSLGARRINEAVIEVARAWPAGTGVAFHHVIGARDWGPLSSSLPTGAGYQAVEYEDRVPTLLAAADLWIGRAGGTTVAELTAVGVPSILVPLPIAPHDHQAVQARRLESQGGCTVVLDGELTGARLASEIRRLLDTPGALRGMADAAAAAGHRDAAERVADLLEANRRG